MTEKLVLGIDGGGTKTAVAIGRCVNNTELSIIGRGLAGPSNILAVGETIALSNIDRALNEASQSAGISPNTISATVLAMAGTSSPNVVEKLKAWANKRGIANKLSIVSDIDPVIKAGTSNNWGLGVIVGTGSIVKGVSRTGKTDIVGGWGYWFGDQGSGYSIGRNALMACGRADDGVGPTTKLTDAVLEKYSIDNARDLIVVMEQQNDVRGELASLARLVCDLAQSSDQVSQSIIQQSVMEVSALCNSMRQRLEFENACPIAFAGGVVCGSEYYRNQMMSKLHEYGFEESKMTTVDQPVIGCLHLAQDLLLKD